ncbi:MAG: hypothetical protein J6O00_10320 [Clostridiales bacterium]|nr:hypothetical protein [Clostridiales bacterium]
MSDDRNTSVEEQNHKQPEKSSNERISLGLTLGIYALIGVFALYLVGNLYKTTVIDYDIYARAASNQQWRLMSYEADRGVIYDANNMPVASNTYNYTVVVSPKILMSSSEIASGTLTRSQLISDLSQLLQMPSEEIDEVLPVDPEDPTDERNNVAGMDLIRNVEAELAEPAKTYCQQHELAGISFLAVPQRYYNYGSLAAQIIGYASNDGVSLNGVYGLEAYYNGVLSGTDGYRYSEVDQGTEGVLPYSDAITQPAVNGNNLVLNIDINIQRIAEEVCRSAYIQYAPRDGICAIVMNPYTGAVLAMVSLPDYDLNDPYGIPYGMDAIVWNSMDDEAQVEYLMGNVWRNRCISDTYEPGSTFKALTTCIAFEENLTNENEVFSDAPIQVSDIDTISCWMQKQYGGNHGMETLREGFENSCNPIFVQLAQRIGVSRYYRYVHMFGFYETTGIDLPAEGTGIFHTDPSVIDMSCLSFGESATVTPIQLINSYCAIVNGGNLMVPHIVRYITDENGNIVDEIEPEVIRTIFSEDTCARVRQLMVDVVDEGTGSAGQVPGYYVAGKTSTSTIENGELAGAHVLSFSCFAPSYDPQIAVLVVLNKPAENSVGSSAAASTAARIVEGTLRYMGVPRILTAEDYDQLTTRYWVQPVVGLSATEAASRIGYNGISCVYGAANMTAETIVGYTYPSTDAQLYSSGIVMLYPEGENTQMLTSTVPNLSGKTAIECMEALRDANLNCYIEGDVMGICVSQGELPNSTVFSGTVVTVTLEDTNVVPDSDVAPTEPESEDGVVSEEGDAAEETSSGAVG